MCFPAVVDSGWVSLKKSLPYLLVKCRHTHKAGGSPLLPEPEMQPLQTRLSHVFLFSIFPLRESKFRTNFIMTKKVFLSFSWAGISLSCTPGLFPSRCITLLQALSRGQKPWAKVIILLCKSLYKHLAAPKTFWGLTLKAEHVQGRAPKRSLLWRLDHQPLVSEHFLSLDTKCPQLWCLLGGLLYALSEARHACEVECNCRVTQGGAGACLSSGHRATREGTTSVNLFHLFPRANVLPRGHSLLCRTSNPHSHIARTAPGSP